MQGIDAPVEFTVGASDQSVDLSLVNASDSVSGTLEITSLSGGSVPVRATVWLLNADGIAIRTLEADSAGGFSFDGVVPGTYSVSAEAAGYSFLESTVTVAGNSTVSVSGFWHVPSTGPDYEAVNSGDSFRGAGGPSATTAARWVKQAIQGLRESLREKLGEPQEEPRLVRVPRAPHGKCIVDVSAAVNSAAREALQWQAAADRFFANWVQRWEAAQEVMWANVGLFGANLGIFAGELALNAGAIESAIKPTAQTAINRVKQQRGEELFVTLLDSKNLQAKEALKTLERKILEMQRDFDLIGQKEAIVESLSAANGALGSIITEGVDGAATSIGAVWDSLKTLATNPSLAAVSDLVGSVSGFGSRIGQHAGVLLSLIPKLEAAASANPALKNLVKNLGPITAALGTISAAAQGVGDGLKDIEALNQFEATYRNALARRDRALAAAYRALSDAKRIANCHRPPPPPPPPPPPKRHGPWRMLAVRSVDPNDITGPEGVGEDRFVSSDTTFPYQIRFENVGNATAPAQEVVITQELPPEMDWATFEVGDFGWGDRRFDVPDGLNLYETRIDLTDTLGFFVDFRADVNHITGVASWTFISIDPATGDLISDAQLGFLPPNTNAPEGEGFVEYSIRPKLNLTDGDRIQAEAEIVFDLNEPINTPVYSNAIDDTAPSSNVIPLPDASPEEFLVSWTADDGLGSGVAGYDVYVSVDGRAFELWLKDSTEASATYVGEVGRSYAFYTVATDQLGLVEEVPAVADAETTVRVPDSEFSVTNAEVLEGDEGGAKKLRFTITRTDNTERSQVRVTTSDGTAVSGLDYQAIDKVVNFRAGGPLSKIVTVPVVGDGEWELDETLQVTLSEPVNATIAQGTATGTILNDDQHGPGAWFEDGTVWFLGTEADDDIRVTRSGADIVLEHSGERWSWPAEDVRLLDLSGEAGSDTFTVEASVPAVLRGGDGDDTLVGSPVADTILGGPGRDSLSGRGGSDVLRGGLGDDWLAGGREADEIRGGGGDDWLAGGRGSDFVSGGNGRDTLHGNQDADSVLGGQVADQITGGDGPDTIYGGRGLDVIDGGAADDVIFGGGGRDRIMAGDGSDTVQGGSGGDTIYGQAGDDVIFASAGTDLVMGGSGADILLGGADADVVLGGTDRDLLIGGTDRDDLRGEAGEDVLLAGSTSLLERDLRLILAEWTSDRSYDSRLANIRGAGTGDRANGEAYLTASGTATAFDDSTIDALSGDGGRDWFFASLTDSLADRDPAEELDVL